MQFRINPRRLGAALAATAAAAGMLTLSACAADVTVPWCAYAPASPAAVRLAAPAQLWPEASPAASPTSTGASPAPGSATQGTPPVTIPASTVYEDQKYTCPDGTDRVHVVAPNGQSGWVDGALIVKPSATRSKTSTPTARNS